MNLLSVAEWLAAFGQTDVSFDSGRCLHEGDRFSTCQTCSHACPTGAITPGKLPTFNPDQCISCGACPPACPSGAFRAGDPLAALFQAGQTQARGELDLYCSRHPRSQVGPTVESAGYRVKSCLAGLSAGAYLALVALGYQRVWVRTDACGDCPINRLEAQIERQVSQGQRLLALWGQEDALVALATLENPVQRPIWGANSTPEKISRRELFHKAAWRHEPVARPPAPSPRIIENEGLLSQDRVQTLRAARQFSPVLRDPHASLQGLGFARLSVSKACTACGACARVCPGGALRFSKNDTETSFHLDFLAEACIGCEACLHICSPGAISLDHSPSAGDIFLVHEATVLQSGALTRCERCHTPFAAQEGHHRLCPLCEYRTTHPFGSILPPGFDRLSAKAEEKGRA